MGRMLLLLLLVLLLLQLSLQFLLLLGVVLVVVGCCWGGRHGRKGRIWGGGDKAQASTVVLVIVAEKDRAIFALFIAVVIAVVARCFEHNLRLPLRVLTATNTAVATSVVAATAANIFLVVRPLKVNVILKK
jgi:hypothetical protein